MHYITILRDPVHRVVSTFNHLLSSDYPEHRTIIAKHPTLEAYLKHRSARNAQTWFITGWKRKPIQRTQGRGKCRDRAYARPIQGCRNRRAFDESLVLFAKKFGWGLPTYVPQNLARSRMLQLSVEDLDDSLIERIRDINRCDIAIYEHACSMFDATSVQATRAPFDVARISIAADSSRVTSILPKAKNYRWRNGVIFTDRFWPRGCTAGKSLGSSRALRTASRSSPIRSCATNSSIGTDQERHGDPAPAFIAAHRCTCSGTPESCTVRRHRCLPSPARPCVQVSPFSLMNLSALLASWLQSRLMSTNRGSPPKVCCTSLSTIMSFWPVPGSPEVEQDQFPSIIAQLEPPALLRGADAFDVEIRGGIADLEGVEKLGGDRPQIERLVRPAAGHIGYGERHVHFADHLPAPPNRASGSALTGKLRTFTGRDILDAKSTILVDLRRKPAASGADLYRIVQSPVDRRFRCPVDDDPAGHRSAFAADGHLHGLARLDIHRLAASTACPAWRRRLTPPTRPATQVPAPESPGRIRTVRGHRSAWCSGSADEEPAFSLGPERLKHRPPGPNPNRGPIRTPPSIFPHG